MFGIFFMPMTLTSTQIDKLKKEFATLMMDSMDIKSMEQFVFDTTQQQHNTTTQKWHQRDKNREKGISAEEYQD